MLKRIKDKNRLERHPLGSGWAFDASLWRQGPVVAPRCFSLVLDWVALVLECHD
jgi:hypothetical protein